tara:strand:- start:189 stop:569 length:381 start_codon:yes stop_codon:yes gene_type:complete
MGIGMVIALVIMSGCTQQPDAPPVEEDPKLTAFAQCVYDSGGRMYGSYTCSVCEKQRALFGPSFKHIQEIECHPRGENSQTQLCLERDIAKTPTWILEPNGIETNRLPGFQSIEALAAFTGCTLEE